MECNIPYKAFYFTPDYFWECNWRNSSFIQHQQEEQEQLEKLLNKTTGKAVHNKNAYYYVTGEKWVDHLNVNKVNSWGNPICYDSNHFYREFNSPRKSKNEKKIGLQTVRDFIDVYGYYTPMNAGEMVKNDVELVRVLKDSKARSITQKNKNEIERKKKQLKREWAFLKYIYNDTSMFGDEKNYNNFLESKVVSGPIFKCKCNYHSRFN